MPQVFPRVRTNATRFEAFDGGLNLRDAQTELDLAETPDCLNVTLDERGGAVARLGLLKLNGSSLLPQPPVTLYESKVAGAWLAYISTDAGFGKLYKSTDGGATWSAVTTTFTAGAQAGITDFSGTNGPVVVLVNTLDGVYSYPPGLGAPTHTAGGTANMDAVRGSAICVWQNKLWVTGDPRDDTTHSLARVWRSNAGNELLWTIATDFIDIRDVDPYACTAIGAGQGMDVTGKATLVVYKEKSVYRINDSSTGAYTTLHNRGAGAASNKAVAANLGRICSVNQHGIWVTDGLAVPIRVTDKLEPLFSADGLNFNALTSWSAAPYRDRIVFSVARNGSSTNNLVLEYHPAVGWTVPHAMTLGPMAASRASGKLYSAAAGSGAFYETFKGGTDDGTAIASRYQTAWVEPGKGDQVRLRAMRLFGRGSPSVQVRVDGQISGDQYPLMFDPGTGFAWGTGVWGTGVWGDPVYESVADTALDEVGKYVSLAFSASTSSTVFRPALLGDGASQEAGSWAVYGAHIDHVMLGT